MKMPPKRKSAVNPKQKKLTSMGIRAGPSTSSPVSSHRQAAPQQQRINKPKVYLVHPSVEDESLLPVSFEDFRKYTNIVEVGLVELRRCHPRSYEERAKDQSILLKNAHFYYLHYFSEPKYRSCIPLKFLRINDSCPPEIRARILKVKKYGKKKTHQYEPPKRAISCFALLNGEPKTSENVSFPVSLQTFKSCSYYNNVVDEILKDCSLGNNEKFEELQWNFEKRERVLYNYYRAFYEHPEQVRKCYKLPLKPCPEYLKRDILKIPKAGKTNAKNCARVGRKPVKERILERQHDSQVVSSTSRKSLEQLAQKNRTSNAEVENTEHGDTEMVALSSEADHEDEILEPPAQQNSATLVTGHSPNQRELQSSAASRLPTNPLHVTSPRTNSVHSEVNSPQNEIQPSPQEETSKLAEDDIQPADMAPSSNSPLQQETEQEVLKTPTTSSVPRLNAFRPLSDEILLRYITSKEVDPIKHAEILARIKQDVLRPIVTVKKMKGKILYAYSMSDIALRTAVTTTELQIEMDTIETPQAADSSVYHSAMETQAGTTQESEQSHATQSTLHELSFSDYNAPVETPTELPSTLNTNKTLDEISIYDLLSQPTSCSIPSIPPSLPHTAPDQQMTSTSPNIFSGSSSGSAAANVRPQSDQKGFSSGTYGNHNITTLPVTETRIDDLPIEYILPDPLNAEMALICEGTTGDVAPVKVKTEPGLLSNLRFAMNDESQITCVGSLSQKAIIIDEEMKEDGTDKETKLSWKVTKHHQLFN